MIQIILSKDVFYKQMTINIETRGSAIGPLVSSLFVISGLQSPGWAAAGAGVSLPSSFWPCR